MELFDIIVYLPPSTSLLCAVVEEALTVLPLCLLSAHSPSQLTSPFILQRRQKHMGQTLLPKGLRKEGECVCRTLVVGRQGPKQMEMQL